jgi:hypothetical protein
LVGLAQFCPAGTLAVHLGQARALVRVHREGKGQELVLVGVMLFLCLNANCQWRLHAFLGCHTANTKIR